MWNESIVSDEITEQKCFEPKILWERCIIWTISTTPSNSLSNNPLTLFISLTSPSTSLTTTKSQPPFTENPLTKCFFYTFNLTIHFTQKKKHNLFTSPTLQPHYQRRHTATKRTITSDTHPFSKKISITYHQPKHHQNTQILKTRPTQNQNTINKNNFHPFGIYKKRLSSQRHNQQTLAHINRRHHTQLHITRQTDSITKKEHYFGQHFSQIRHPLTTPLFRSINVTRPHFHPFQEK